MAKKRLKDLVFQRVIVEVTLERAQKSRPLQAAEAEAALPGPASPGEQLLWQRISWRNGGRSRRG
jgi:hypothetical protein